MNLIKYKSLTLIAAILVLIGWTACESLIDDFDYEKKPSKLVVNAILNPDSIISIHISSSISYNPPSTYKQVENAVIELFENDQLLGQLLSKGRGYYTLSETYPKEGAIYKVLVAAEGYQSVWAETTIPRKIENMKVENSMQTTYRDGYSFSSMECRINYEVPLNQYVFYGTSVSSQKQGSLSEYICVERETPYFNGYYYEMDSCYRIEPDSLATRTEHISFYSNSSLIKFFKGSRSYYMASYNDGDYSEKIYFSNKNYGSNNLPIVISTNQHNLLHNINNEITIWTDSYDEILYNFMYSLAKKEELDEDPFAEKVSVYSNVHGGLGVFGSTNSTSYPIQYEEYNFDTSMYNN